MNQEEKKAEKTGNTYVKEEEYPVTPKEILITEKAAEEKPGDLYDLYGMATDVHSRYSEMTKDYTLGRYNTTIINEKFPKFLRKQFKMARLIEPIMVPEEKKLIRKYWYLGEETAKAMAKEIILIATKHYEAVKKNLLAEADEMVIITRTGKGQVIDSMLTHGKSREEIEGYEEAQRRGNILEKLKEKQKR